jgi:hypothetical protein
MAPRSKFVIVPPRKPALVAKRYSNENTTTQEGDTSKKLPMGHF